MSIYKLSEGDANNLYYNFCLITKVFYKKVFCIDTIQRSVSSMLPLTGGTLIRNYMIWMCHQSLAAAFQGHNTVEAFFKEFIWSMKACKAGKWPYTNSDGTPVTGWRANMAGQDLFGGFTMWLWAIIGDLVHYMQNLRLPNSTKNSPCSWCPCNSTDLPWFDFRPVAGWLDHVYSAEAWFNTEWAQCGLFCKELGISVLTVYPDWMHCKHLGIDKVLLGSVLWLLVNLVLSESLGDPEARLTFLMTQIFEQYERLGSSHRYGAIKMTMFSATRGKKVLKGKACEVKGLGPVLLVLWRQFMNKNIDLHVKVEAVLTGSCRMDEIIDGHPGLYGLPQIAAADLVATGHVYFCEWYSLQKLCKELHLPGLFGMTSKAHFLMHCAILSRSLKYHSNIYIYIYICIYIIKT